MNESNKRLRYETIAARERELHDLGAAYTAALEVVRNQAQSTLIDVCRILRGYAVGGSSELAIYYIAQATLLTDQYSAALRTVQDYERKQATLQNLRSAIQE